MSHTKEALNFDGSAYYGALSTEQGFGGFNYGYYMEYMNATYWENVATGWCDTGVQNVTGMSKNAVGCGWVYDVGVMESANIGETFSLKSMIAASAWSTNQVWEINSYTYVNGGLSLKASDTITLSQTAQKINFATIGNKRDFSNIVAVVFIDDNGLGGAGNTCSYGAATYGYEMAFDHLKVSFNGGIPSGARHEKFLLPPGLARHHHLIAHVEAQFAHGALHVDGILDSHHAPHHASSGYHTQLLSLDHNTGGLTSQFHIPLVDHFLT